MTMLVHNRFAVWLVAAMLAMPFAVRTAHVYHSHVLVAHHSDDADGHGSRHHDCNTCPVCKFAFHSFTATPVVSYDSPAISVETRTVIPSFDRPATLFLFPCGLRAPPVA